MKTLFAVFRILAAGAIVVAIVAQYGKSASMTQVNPFNFFGYFTIQSNIIAAVAFLASAWCLLRDRVQPSWLIYLRAQATVVMAIVGVVYNLLLADLDLAGAFNLAWSNTILHVVIPIYAVLDWGLFGDRAPLPLRKLGTMLIFPALWLIVVLIRGATDGWVPYPFLDPAQAGGYGTVLVYALGIAGFTIVFACGVFALTRVTLLRPGTGMQRHVG